jgi:hypothetical protein
MPNLSISGPDDNLHIWLHWTDEAGHHSLNIGERDEVLGKFANFLAANDYEERVALPEE